MNSYLEELNPMQRAAVESLEGPVIVLAGAGSGKTKTLTSRVVHLIHNGVAPASILAVTFTNKAAKEMKERVGRALEHVGVLPGHGRWTEPWMGFSSTMPEVATFHSFCLKLLRTEADAAGYERSFVIYDDSDQRSLLKKIVKQLGLTGRLANPKMFQGAINKAKTQAWSPSDLAEHSKPGPLQDTVVEVYELYQNELQANQSMDFGDIIVNAYRLLANRPDILEKYQDRFRYLMVDEYQDTNRAQYLLVTLLAKKHRNLCVVGDEDQSIYKWRGADIRNILDFQSEYSEAKLVKLEENYRSTQMIIEAAAHVIRHNEDRYEKTLFTNNEKGERIKVLGLENERSEADRVANEIGTYIAKGHSGGYNDVALFYRSHAQSRAIEEAFRRERVPYRIVGGVGFYERKEIKDLLAYLRVLANPDDSVSLARIINVPARGIGKASIDKLEQLGRREGVSLYAAIGRVMNGAASDLGPAARKKLNPFFQLIQKLRDMVAQSPITDIVQTVLEDSGYLLELKEENTEESRARVENLEEFYTVVRAFDEECVARGWEQDVDRLPNFLNQITLESQALANDENEGAVSMMTLHSSKGLEFPLVFLVGCEDGIFPSKRAIDESEWENSAIEEERRLCYVGITRAKKQLYMTYAGYRRIHGQTQVSPPSRFIGEIPDSHKEVIDLTRRESAPRSWGTGEGGSSRFGLSAQPKGEFYDYEDSQLPAVDIDASVGDTGESVAVGARVLHATYGKGTVRALEGAEGDRKVVIEFGGYQKKKFLLKYVKLQFL